MSNHTRRSETWNAPRGEGLLQRFQTQELDDVVDVQRVNVAGRRAD